MVQIAGRFQAKASARTMQEKPLHDCMLARSAREREAFASLALALRATNGPAHCLKAGPASLLPRKTKKSRNQVVGLLAKPFQDPRLAAQDGVFAEAQVGGHFE
jgi:hypothetical protein